MANPHGTPIWYELMTPDHAAAKAFYDAVIGWTVGDRPPGDMDYRMIATADGGHVGGVMALTEAMTSGGSRPGWLFYLSVDDVDRCADAVTAAGGAVLMPPFDIAGAGRAAFVADPQGAPFYIMRGASDGDSTAFAPTQNGHAAWNELSTGDTASALTFYGKLFGWENRETMEMGPMGGYHFLDAGETRLGALMGSQQADQPPGWLFYFAVDDVDAVVERVTAGGGAVAQGPMDVPGGGRIIVATDPHGATFGLVSPTSKQE